MRRRTALRMLLVCLSLGMAVPAEGATIYVDKGANGPTYDGTSWCTAYLYLQDALAIAQDGDTIRVAQGAYKPDEGAGQTAGDRTATFQLINGVVVQGGYAGCGEIDPDARDISLFGTVLSGDLLGDDDLPVEPSNCCTPHGGLGCDIQSCEDSICQIWEECCALGWDQQCAGYAPLYCCVGCSEKHDCENSYHVVTGSGTDRTAVLDGFLVTSGRGTTEPNVAKMHRHGAGLNNLTGSPTVLNCTFAEGFAIAGGGVYNLSDSFPLFINCRFTNNRATHYGAGVYDSLSASTLIDCVFDGNVTSSGASPSAGAFRVGGNSIVINCGFFGNRAAYPGEGSAGGAITIASYSDEGRRPRFVNCVFSGNSAGTNGGAVYNTWAHPTFTNCTFVGNSVDAPDGGGGIYGGTLGEITITNSLLYENEAGGVGGESAQILIGSGDLFIKYSNVEGWTGALGGMGNIGAVPLLADSDGADNVVGTIDDDLRLLPDSPCIDAGTNDADTDASLLGLQRLPSWDIDNLPRYIDILDVPDTGDSGALNLPNVDIGAYEHIEDCNGNNVDDATDVAMGTSNDCNDNGIPDDCEQDCNGNGQVDECDITLGASLDCANDGLPDECEPDCNTNSVADSCDILNDTSIDDDNNGIPDECDAHRLYVVEGAAPGGDGQSWAMALPNPQDAIDIAFYANEAITEIWVAQGTYVPTGPNQSWSFDLVAGVAVYGGFNGTETCLDQRDWIAYPTILSGDANGDDVGDFDDPSRADNFRTVVTAYETDYSTVLDGFIVSDGHATSSGAGIRVFGGAVTLRNLVVRDNFGSRGGGILVIDGEADISHCRIEHNLADDEGGGLHVTYDAKVDVHNCVFDDNRSVEAGGGLWVEGATSIVGCQVTNNTADGYYGGGGIYIDSGGAVVNCLIAGNSAVNGGGGLYVDHQATISNCTITDNHGDEGGGIFADYGSTPTIQNSIVWGNMSQTDTGEAAQIFTEINTNVDVQYSCVQGWTGSFGGLGNFGADPQLAAPGYELMPNSPCIDAADNQVDMDLGELGVQELPELDITGAPRFVDIAAVADVGNGIPPIVDMGAYEHLTDCNSNGTSDADDIAGGDSGDCDANGVPDECQRDCNQNGIADSCDISSASSTDLNGNGIPDECEVDCNGNSAPDDYDIAEGASVDCNANAIPDECESDCNASGQPDACDVVDGTSQDCNSNGIPDECDVADGTSSDCTSNGLPDECEVDCNGNGNADSCDILDGVSEDCTFNGVPDECESDCNNNSIADSCDLQAGTSGDCDSNAVPDECDPDCNFVTLQPRAMPIC